MTPHEFGNLTGHQLMDRLAENGHRIIGKVYNLQVGDVSMNVWETTGKGRNQGCYVHFSTEKVFKIVTPDGEDTGSRLTDTLHFRGKASQKVGTYHEV